MPEFISMQKIMFQHCDPARIVFYPRYFELINAVVEQWFEEGIGVPFAEMHMQREEGVPTLKTDAWFPAPSRLGDVLEFSLQVKRIGNSSIELRIRATCGAETRLESNLTLVHISNLDGKSKPWPEDMRQPMQAYLASPEQDGEIRHA